MKIIKLQVDCFLPALSQVCSIVPSKTTLAILSDVRFETKKDNSNSIYAELTTSDNDMWLQMKAPLLDAESGIVFCLDAKSILQGINNLKGKTITMTINEANKIVTCDYDNGQFSLPYDVADPFPMPIFLGVADDARTKIVEGKKLLTAIEKAAFATANDELRPVMNGVHFDFTPTAMVAVASNGYQLAKYADFTLANAEPDTVGFTLPKKPCSTLLKVLSNTNDGNVNVVFNNRCVIVQNSLFHLTSRLIEGRYPDYNKVIPKDNDRVVIVSKADFIFALQRVMPMGNAVNELISLAFANGDMIVSAEDLDFSKSGTEHVACDYMAADKFLIGFKGSVLLQLLQNIEGDKVKLMLKEPHAACVICEDKPNDTHEYTSLIMPMLLNQ